MPFPKAQQHLIWSSAATKFYLVVCLYTLDIVQPPHCVMYICGDWSVAIIFLFLFLCGALKGSDFTESEEDDGLLGTFTLLVLQDWL